MSFSVYLLFGLFLAEAVPSQYSRIDIESSAIYWQVTDAQGTALTVSGPDGIFRQEFEPGDVPQLGLFDPDGNPLPDGSYTWELRLTPERSPGKWRVLRDRLKSGYFRILDGLFVVPQEEGDGAVAPNDAGAGLVPKDQSVLDDLIVDGSLCVGLDCANGEDFGDDVIRLKENVVRIKLEDSSGSPGYPTNDWQLTANDSASGGADRFSIEDVDGGTAPFTIEAGASDNALYVDDNDRIGIGTATPVEKLEIQSSSDNGARIRFDDGNQWNLGGGAGNTFFIGEAGDAAEFTVNSAGDIRITGDVGVGTGAPDASLHVQRSDGSASIHVQEDGGIATNSPLLLLESTQQTAQILQLEMTNSAGKWRLDVGTGGNFSINKGGTGGSEIEIRDRNDGSGGATLTVRGSVDATNVTFTSSREMKEDFTPLSSSEVLEKVAGLEISSWRFKEDPSASRHIGPVAEDFNAAFPLGGDGRRISALDLSGVALKAIQGLHAKLERLAAANTLLEKRLAELEVSDDCPVVEGAEGRTAEIRLLPAIGD